RFFLMVRRLLLLQALALRSCLCLLHGSLRFLFFHAADGIRVFHVTGVQTLLFRSCLASSPSPTSPCWPTSASVSSCPGAASRWTSRGASSGSSPWTHWSHSSSTRSRTCSSPS